MVAAEELAAMAFTALTAGATLFVSAVDVPTFTQLDDATAKALFKAWYNHAFSLMVPLIGATAVASSTAFLETQHKAHLASAVLVGCVPLYTRAVLMPSIDELRDHSKATRAEPLKRWAKLHHVRTGLALSALAFTLLALRRRD